MTSEPADDKKTVTSQLSSNKIFATQPQMLTMLPDGTTQAGIDLSIWQLISTSWHNTSNTSNFA